MRGLQRYPGSQPKVRSESGARGAEDPVGIGHSVTSKIGVTVRVTAGLSTVLGPRVIVVVTTDDGPGIMEVIV